MNPYRNKKKKSFIDKIPTNSLDDTNQNIGNRSKFNFSYFDNCQAAGQDFNNWTKEQLLKLLGKLKEYSREPLDHWTTIKIGSGRHRYNVLEEYGSFPRTSDFIHPKHVPHQASWARFRIDQSVRLIGFRIPEEYKGKFDRNTFYIVFLDKDHRFYKTNK